MVGLASSFTNTAVTVATTPTTILAANGKRKYAVIVNDSTEPVYLKFGAGAVMNSGVRLNAQGGSLLIDKSNLYTGLITGICTSGSMVVTVLEAY